MLGTSYLTDYAVLQPVGTFEPEVIAQVRQKGVNPKIFKDEDEANWAAKQLGGTVIEVSWEGDSNDD